MDRIKIAQKIGGDVCEGCSTTAECGETPEECGRIINAMSVIDNIAAEALGWCHADACVDLDEGKDPRLKNVPELFERAKKDLF